MQAPGPSRIRARVLIADDHSIVADGLRSVLEKSCEVIGIVQDGRQLLIEAPKLKPDVIVLDIGMPFLNGLDAAERLKPSTAWGEVRLLDDEGRSQPCCGRS